VTFLAIIFSKEHAAQAAELAVKTDLKSLLFLCVNQGRVFRSVGECIHFFDEN
jgi:hypothetical protein